MTAMPPALATALHVVVLLTAVYAVMLVAYVAVMLGFAFWESRFRRRQQDAEDLDAVLGSRYTIPVSVIAPVFNEEIMAVPAVRSLLALAYPELEVIVVDDGSADGTLAALITEYGLEPRQVFYRETLAAKPVQMVYRSVTEPRLTVVCKANGGKADALNCGINFARYRYLCCVDGDTIFAPGAILSAMSLIARDPARIVGAASLFGISREPETTRRAARHDSRTNDHLLADFQHLDLMRAFVAYRAAWSRLQCMLCVAGAFALWRRDVILEMGGFSSAFTCEDIEMTFRIHEKFLREKREYRILSLPEMVAQTEGPTSIRSLVSQRARWQRVTLETIWHYRRMLGRPRYRSVGLVGMPYYALFECLAPLFQVLSVASLAVAALFGVLGWQTYLTLLGLVVFATAVPTTVAVLLHDASYRDYRISALIRMCVLGPLDLLLYRPILMYAGARGTWEFMRGHKGWNKFERNVRRVAPAAVLTLLLSLAGPWRAQAQHAGPVAAARQLAREGRRDEAMAIVERRLVTDSSDADARVLHATLLSWRGELAGARRELHVVLSRQPDNADALVALAYVELWSGHADRANRLATRALATNADNVDALVVRATTLRQLNRRADALGVIERAAALSPAREDVAHLGRVLRHEVHGSEVLLTGGTETWGDHRGAWREAQLSARRNTPDGVGVVRLSRAARAGLHDDRLELEAYPRLGAGYAALGVGYASTATLYPRTTVAAELFERLPGNVEGSLGYRRLDFTDAVDVVTASVGMYRGELLYSARVNRAAGGARGTSLLVAARRYFADGEQYAELHLGGGSIREDVRSSTDLATISNRLIGADAMLLVRDRWILTLRADVGRVGTRDSEPVVQRTVSLGVGMRM